jgi:hypothetical protein
VKQLRRTETDEADAEFEALVRLVDGGTESDPVTINGRLRELGRTPEQLAAAIDIHRQRIAWRQTLDAAEGLDEQLADLHKQLRDEEARFAEEQKTERRNHEAIIANLDGRARAVESRISDANRARDNLCRTAPPAITDQLAAIAEQSQSLKSYALILQNRISRARGWIEYIESNNRLNRDRNTGPGLDHDGKQRQEHRRQIEAHQQEAEDLQGQSHALDERRAQLQRLMLVVD